RWPRLPSARPAAQTGGAAIERFPACTTPEERAAIARVIARHRSAPGRQEATLGEPAPYPFFPHAGNVWDDLFISHFVDLDPGTGILDWEGTDWSYNGHTGHDSLLRSFAEQEIGVPVFAALNGSVVALRDGEPDRNTVWRSVPANFVILYHGGTHYTVYYHLKAGSVSVVAGQQVRAGQQIGLTGSSGTSSWPHLHFESWRGSPSEPYEPSAGPSRPGRSYWARQIPIRRDLFLSDFRLTDAPLAEIPGLPAEIPPRGTFVRGTRRVGFWVILHNLSPYSTWRARYLRPDGSVRLDTGEQSVGNSSHWRWRWQWAQHEVALDATGTWHLLFEVNDTPLIRAPFRVVGSPEEAANRPPEGVTAALDPAVPRTDEAVFCRVRRTTLPDDPDYEVVRYRYRWSVGGSVVREVTTAGRADAIPGGLTRAGDLLACEVTPLDGALAAGPPAAARAVVAADPAAVLLPAGLHLLGIPASIPPSSPAEIGLDGARFATWDAAARAYRQGAEVPPIAAGQGIWVKSDAPLLVRLPGQPAAGPVSIPLQPGWNLVSVPFAAPIAWDPQALRVRRGGEERTLAEAAAAGWVADGAWGWDSAPDRGRYVPVSDAAAALGGAGALEPWRAYWVKAGAACDLVVAPAAGRAAGGRAPGGSWSVRVRVEEGDASAEVVLGVAGDGRRIALAAPPPPPAGDSPALKAEIETPSGPLAVDLRPGASLPREWTLALRPGPAATPGDGALRRVTLRWPDARRLPDGVSLVLTDPATGERRWLRATGGYTFTWRGEPRRFQITAEARAGAPPAITDVEVIPSRSGRSIAFTLSAPASVAVEILSPTGRTVRRVVTGRLAPAGRTRVAWDGRDERGVSAPSGILLVQVTATAESGATARAVRPVVLVR
ncbi:MAG: peptidoglycan DD-metalloendopeptidase family protein, partial [Armatimonadetes bacterium]|nr:peptidoglycan DD-metalloendopeptidase family protein [Armatimonadota bacterium]